MKKTARHKQNDKVEEASKESFPASDSPASGLPDRRPVNADEKWLAAAKKKRRRAQRRRRATV